MDDSFVLKTLGFLFSGLALIAGMALAWTFRYTVEDGRRAWTLTDMEWIGPEPRSQSHPGGIPVGMADEGEPFPILFRLPGNDPVDALHLEYRVRRQGLKQGDADWKKGRIAVQWLSPDGRGAGEYDPVHDFSGDGLLEIRSRVVAPAIAPAVPRIWLQDFGVGGGYILELIKVQPVTERGSWKWVLRALGGLTFIWFTLVFRQLGSSRYRAMIQSAVCLFMTAFAVLPQAADIKPQIWRGTFHLGSQDPSHVAFPADRPEPSANPPEKSPPAASTTQVEPVVPGDSHLPVPPVQTPTDSRITQGAVSAKGTFVSWLHMHMRSWMVAVHLLAFATPSFVLAILGRIRHAWWIGAFFAAASEGSQWLFEDNTTHSDLIDLGVNTIGVALGVGIAYVAKSRYFWRWRKGEQE